MDILRASPTPIVLVVIGKKGIDKLSNRELREHITALSTRVQ